MSIASDTTFPSPRLPDRPGARRLLGIYEQRQQGFLMQRVKVSAGRLTAGQWRALARAAVAHTPGYPLHVTTRQDVEFHGLPPERVPDVHKVLDAAGMTTLGAAGDTLRNVTVCPGCGICPDTMDVSDLADTVRRAVEGLPWVRELPRKFKISVSGCERACARPYVNDLGIVARPEGGLLVIGAGSLGARPRTGIVLYEALPVCRIVALVVAALKLFHAQGDRENRRRARLRHVRERLGDEEFRSRLDDRLRAELSESSWPQPQVSPVAPGNRALQARVFLPRGDIESGQVPALVDAAEPASAVLRIGLVHDLLLYGERAVELPEDMAGWTQGPPLVACPGRTWCPFGVADSRAAIDRIRAALPAGSAVVVAASGCPNNCAHAAVADIGMTGRTRKVKGVATECFRLVAGGGNGVTPEMGIEVHSAVPAERVPEVVAHLARLHEGHEAEDSGSFARYVREHQQGITQQVQDLLNQ